MKKVIGVLVVLGLGFVLVGCDNVQEDYKPYESYEAYESYDSYESYEPVIDVQSGYDFVETNSNEDNNDMQATSDVDFSSHPIVGTWESIGFSHHIGGNWYLDDTFTGSFDYFGADGSFKMFRTGPGAHHWDENLISENGRYIFQTGVWHYENGLIFITGDIDLQGINPARNVTWYFEYMVDGNYLRTVHEHSPGGRFEYIRVQ